jgi:nitrate reductase alpha subunit
MLPSADAARFGGYFSLFADLFLRLIKMIIAPLVFCTLVIGVTRIGDVHAVGRIGLRTLGWFLVASDREWANPPKCHQSGRTIRLSVSFDQIQGEFK